jgi:hypothetical protein
VVAGYGKLLLHFEANQGQTEGQVRFLARGSGYGLFLTPTESVLSLKRPEAGPPAVLRMKLLGANPRPVVVGREELPGKSNYFIGNDPKKWRTNVPQYARVEYEDVYPGVNLAYYGNQGQIEYDFVVNPGANPRRIRFGIEGADAVRMDEDGNLVMAVRGGEVVQRAPVIYQEVDGVRKAVDGRFVLDAAREVGFEVGAYDSNRPLVLDPLLVYSTYLGGGDFEMALGIAVDASGNAYVTGATLSTDFPTANALQGAKAGGIDTFVAKLDAAGSAVIYSSYVGGSGDEYARDIAVDGSGNAYVTGWTLSTNFPTGNALQAASGGSFDAFVTKLDATGAALAYSTYLGGSDTDQGLGIAVDTSGNAYVAGQTNSTNFPTANPLQAVNAGASDAFVAKLNAAGSALVYSTYLGGEFDELGTGVAVTASGNAYVTGWTGSTDFPTANPLQAVNTGNNLDAFVTQLSASGSALVYSTYLGGSAEEQGWGIAVDTVGNAYVSGLTFSTNFPTANAIQASNGGNNDAYVAKLNAGGSALVYSTYLGGSGHDNGFRVAVDPSGSAYVTGNTDSVDFPAVRPPQGANGGNFDAFATKLNATGSALAYSTYLGGTNVDQGLGIAVDAAGNAYVTGDTQSPEFPTSNPLQAERRGTEDAFVTKIGSQLDAPGGHDATGEGREDVLLHAIGVGEIRVLTSTGASFMQGGAWTAGFVGYRYEVYFADVSGDGLADLVSRNKETGDLDVFTSSGTAFAYSAGNGPGGVWSYGWGTSYELFFADVTGDGRADLIGRYANGDVYVFPSTGSGFSSGAPGGLWSYGWSSGYDLYFADVTGDGRADLVSRYFGPTAGLTGDIYVGVSTGTGFASPQRWTYGYSAGYEIHVADADGDSKADLISRYLGDNQPLVGDVHVMHSTGNAFSWNGNTTRWSYGWGSSYEILLRDVTGDGRADLVSRNRNAQTDGYGWMEVAASTGSSLSYLPNNPWITGIDASYDIH